MNILWNTKPIFISKEMYLHRIVECGYWKIHSQFNQYHFILQRSLFGAGLLHGLFQGYIFLTDGGSFGLVTRTTTGKHYEYIVRIQALLPLQLLVNPVKQLLKLHLRNARIIRRHFFATRLSRSPNFRPKILWLRDYMKVFLFSHLNANLAELKAYISLHILKMRTRNI